MSTPSKRETILRRLFDRIHQPPEPFPHMSKPKRELTNDEQDARIIKPSWILRKLGVKRLIRAFINRGYERGYLTSFAYHEMHAMIDRVL